MDKKRILQKKLFGCHAYFYMQNISLPCILVQQAYYLHQLPVYVFGIHSSKDNTASFCVYHEGRAQKGINEVCSFLLQYINNCIPPEVQELFCLSITVLDKIKIM